MQQATQDRTAVPSLSHYGTKANWLKAILSAGQLPLVVYPKADAAQIAIVGRAYDAGRDAANWQYIRDNKASLVPFLSRLGLIGTDAKGNALGGCAALSIALPTSPRDMEAYGFCLGLLQAGPPSIVGDNQNLIWVDFARKVRA